MRGARRFARWGVWLGGSLVLLAAVLICIDVLMRKFFNASIGGADELAGYALAIGTAWSLGSALLERAHIRIDSLYVLLPGKLRIALDFAGLALLTGYFGLIAWHGWAMVMQSWTSNSHSQSALQTPTVIPQAIWILGLAFFVAIGTLLFVHGLVLAARGKPVELAQAIGTRSVQEDVEGEVRDLAERGARGQQAGRGPGEPESAGGPGGPA